MCVMVHVSGEHHHLQSLIHSLFSIQVLTAWPGLLHIKTH